jgi:hypothetical protein
MIIAELFAKLGLQVDKGSWDKGEKALGGLKVAMAAVVAGIGISSIKHMIDGVAELADAAVKSSAKLGITTDAVQELGYAAKLSDISQGELEMSLTKLSRGLEAAKKGEGAFVDTLGKLKIKMSELKGETLDQNLERIAEAFKRMPDGPQKAALAMELFGRSGTRLIPLLNSGKAGIVELRKEAHELGIVVDNETAKSFEEFNDEQTKLSEMWRGIKTQIVTALLPSLREIVAVMQDWLKENRELIGQGLKIIIQGVTFAFKGLVLAAKAVVEIIEWFKEGSDEAQAVLIAIAIVIASIVVPALYSMAVGWIAALGPILLIVAAIAAVVYGVIKLVKHWDKVKAAGIRAFEALHDKLGDFARYIIVEIPAKIHDGFVDLGEGIKDALGAAFDWVIQKAKDTWDEIRNAPVIKQIFDFGGELFESAMPPGFVQQQQANSQFATPTPMYSPDMAGITMGDTKIEVTATPGMNEQQLAEEIEKRAAATWGGKIQEAHAAMRGGRR